MADAVVAALAEKYALGEDFALAVCGGSMGGLGALNYAADSRYELKCVAAACPCVDTMKNLTVLPDFPRTFVSAVAAYDMPLTNALKEISPFERLNDMPRIPYYICIDGADELFPEEQCDSYVDRLRTMGHEVEYVVQPGLLHGGFIPEVREQLHVFLENCILR